MKPRRMLSWKTVALAVSYPLTIVFRLLNQPCTSQRIRFRNGGGITGKSFTSRFLKSDYGLEAEN